MEETTGPLGEKGAWVIATFEGLVGILVCRDLDIEGNFTYVRKDGVAELRELIRNLELAAERLERE